MPIPKLTIIMAAVAGMVSAEANNGIGVVGSA